MLAAGGDALGGLEEVTGAASEQEDVAAIDCLRGLMSRVRRIRVL